MKKTWKQRFGAIATAFMLALSIPVSASAAAKGGDSSGNGEPEESYYVISGYNKDRIIQDLAGNRVPGHAYCLDNKQNPPSIIRTKGGDIDTEKTPRYKRVLLSELDTYTKKVYKGTRNGVPEYYEEYERVLTDNVKSRLLKVLMNESAIREKARSITISDADLADMKSKTSNFNEEEHSKRWKYITDSDSTLQQIIWTVVHDDSEWAFYVKDHGETTHHEDCYTFNETRFQYVSADPLNDPLSLWNIYYKPMIDYIDTEITEDYYREGYDAWVYMTYRDDDINNQNMLSTPFKKMDTMIPPSGGGSKDENGGGGFGGNTPQSTDGIVKILKVDENGSPLAGASLKVVDDNGIANASVWTSGTKAFEFYVTQPGEYTIVETKAPAGYFKTDSVTFTVDEYGFVYINGKAQNTSIKIENKEKTEVRIKKTDINGENELPGAHLVIYRKRDINEYGVVVSDAKKIDEWDSGTEDHVITGVLEAGEVYILRETVAPEGYAITTDTPFYIVADGENKGKVALPDPNGTDITDTIYEDIIIVKDDVLPDAHIPVPAVSKKLTGNDRPEEKEFTFEIKAAAETPDAPLPETTTVKVTGEGEAKFPDIVTNKIGTFYYEIAEVAGSDTGYTYDPTVYKFGVMTMINGGVSVAYNTVLTLDFENIQPLEKAEFTNEYAPVPAFVEVPVAVKKIDGCVPAESDKTFTFGITAEENAEAAADIPMPANTEVTVNGSGSASSFGKITFTKAGVFTYKIAECDLNDTHRGYTRDEGVYTLTVTVTDEGGELKAAYEITKDGEPVNELIFTNKYQPAPVSVTVPTVVKKISGDVSDNEAKTFSFGIRAAADSAGDTPLPAKTAAEVTGSGNCTFGNITFDKAGTFAYEITENDLTAEHKGYTRDDSVYRFEVKVIDRDAALVIESAVLTKNGETAANAEFVNEYKPYSVKVGFDIEKKIRNGKAGDTFEFRLFNFDTGADEFITINGEGTDSFSEVEYTEPGVHSYSVSEIPGSARKFVYDSRVFRITDTVTDINGQLVVSRTITSGSGTFSRIVFENELLTQSGGYSGGSSGGSTTVPEGEEGSGDTDGGSTDGGNTDGGNTDGGSTDDSGNTDGGNTDGGNTDGGSTEGGSTDGGSTGGGNTDGGNTDGGNTEGGSTDGGSTGGGNTDGGNTDGGNTDGGNTDGGSTGGGNTDGGNTDDGNTGSGSTPEAGGGSDGGSNPATGTAGMIGAGALAVCAVALFVRKRNK